MSTHPSTTESSVTHEISGVLVRVVRVLMLTSRTRLMSTFTRVGHPSDGVERAPYALLMDE